MMRRQAQSEWLVADATCRPAEGPKVRPASWPLAATFALWATLTLPGAARAALITTEADLPAPSALVTFNNFNGQLLLITPNSPRQVGGAVANIVATSDNFNVFVGQPEPFQLGPNGRWEAITKSAFAGGNAPSF